ncbi:MAG: Ig-like domain-containing protein, partial [Candidatus Dormiibacterota bacterium]
MSRRWPWSGQRSIPQMPDGVDSELWAIFLAQDGGDGPQLMETAQELRRRIEAQPPTPADPAFQTRLRANLMAEASASRRSAPRPRRFPLPLPATLGIASLAVAAVVVVSVVALPLQRGQVEIQAAVAGHHQVPVTQAIRISFNRPMDESAVLRGLTIKPAVSYQASWPNSKTLLLSPAHGLAPNVGYVVTIAQPAVKAQNGAVAPSGIVIPFGTGSAPSTPQGQIPTLVSVTPIPVTTGVTAVSYMPDGALLVLATGAPSSVPSPTPSSSPTAPTEGSATTGLTFGDLYVLTPSLRAVATDSAGAVASPDSQEIAFWTPASSGNLSLDVVPASGSGSPQTLATSAESDPGLAWLDNGDLLYAAAGQLREVSLDGQITAVYPSVHVDPSGFFTLSPSAQALFARPGGVPTVYSLPSGSATAISTLVGIPAWAASGTDLAYIADNNGNFTVDSSSDLGAQSTVLFTASAGSQLSDLGFDPTGTYLTYVATTG